MVFHIITIFPEIFDSYFKEGIVARAMKKGVFDVKIYDLRNYTTNKHRKVDDTPYGGGPGMVLKVEPIFKCIEDIKYKIKYKIKKSQPKADPPMAEKVVLFSAKGGKYSQQRAKDYSKLDHLIMICGRYEGIDERVAQYLADEELSIGDYVLTGGEIPAMVVVDSVGRLVDGALGNPKSLESETFNGESPSNEGIIDYPVYTKPEDFNGWKVPKVLLSGDHGKIKIWRKGKMKNKNG